MQPEQINWHRIRNAEYGVPTFVVIRDEQRQLYVINGVHAERINEMTQPEASALSVASSFGALWEVMRSL